MLKRLIKDDEKKLDIALTQWGGYGGYGYGGLDMERMVVEDGVIPATAAGTWLVVVVVSICMDFCACVLVVNPIVRNGNASRPKQSQMV